MGKAKKKQPVDISEDLICKKAYEIWLARQQFSAEDDWEKAKEILQNELNALKKPFWTKIKESHIWAISYLSLIPICAFAYYLLPRLDSSQFHFYHASAQYEKALYNDANNVIEELQSQITENFQKYYSKETTSVNGWNISIENLKVRGIKIKDEDKVEINFKLQKTEKMTPDGKIGEYNIGFKAIVPILGQDSRYIGLDTVCKRLLFEPDYLTLGDGQIIKLTTIFPPSLCPPLSLVLSENSNSHLKGFWRAARGFPTETSEGFIRMLYFSAITITTIGYGDIYPISNIARLIVSFEAISGVILVGLFLNAVVKERKN